MRAILCTILILGSSALAELPGDARVKTGVAALVPATNADDLCELSNRGNVLVHGLAPDAPAAQAITAALRERGLQSIVTAVRTPGTSSLPYADNLLNLAVVDGDALPENQRPAEAEIRRVLAPGGRALVRSGGQWKTIVKARPAEMDDWTHFDHDAAGTGVSNDRLVKPPAQLQWWCETQEYIGLGGNPAGYRPYTGFRIANGRAFALYGEGKIGDAKKDVPVFMIARDAFNGVPLWKIPAYSSGNGTPQEYQFVASDDRVFAFLKPESYPVAIDAASGKVLITYEKAAKLEARSSKVSPGYNMLRRGAGLLVQTAANRLIVLDARTGELKWSHEEKDDWLSFPRIVEKEGRILVQAVEGNQSRIQGRWANLKTSALLCFDLTGKLLWRCTEIGGSNWGQSIWSGEKIFLFCPAGIGAAENWGKNPQGTVACLSSKDGKLIWKTREKYTWGYNLLVREGRPFFAMPDAVNQVDPASGEVTPFWKAAYNNRCNRTSATPEYIIMGLGIFVDKNGTATVKSIARSGCAQGAFPAHGLSYFTPNTCWCITQLRGHLALSGETVGPAVADETRLQVLDAKPGGVAKAGPMIESLLSSEWGQVLKGASETPVVAAGDKSYVAMIHQHVLECRSGGKLLWSFAAGGRITHPPLVVDDRLLFGSHDGYVYCLRATDGAPLWRFLAAPSERWVVSHGQLESSWPVYNVVLHNGKICFTAGLHPELGGGIHAWGLDPKTGAVAWHKVIKRSEVVVPNGPKNKIAPNRVLNSPLASDGKLLSITGLSFSPEEADEQIQDRIDKGSLGDKNRNLGWTIRGTEGKK